MLRKVLSPFLGESRVSYFPQEETELKTGSLAFMLWFMKASGPMQKKILMPFRPPCQKMLKIRPYETIIKTAIFNNNEHRLYGASDVDPPPSFDSFDAHWRSLTHQEEDVQRGLRAALPRREGELAHPSFFLQLQMSLPCAVSFPLFRSMLSLKDTSFGSEAVTSSRTSCYPDCCETMLSHKISDEIS